MPIHRAVVAAAVALVLLLPAASTAQVSPQPQINLQYHEVIPTDADSTPVILKIFDRLRKDCERIGKAFGRKCVISQATVNVNANYGGDMTGVRNLNANATIMLLPEATEASPSR